jgi:hypothetical protein
VRRKIDDELPQDAKLLCEHHPKLFEELRATVCKEHDDSAALREQLATCRAERDRIGEELTAAQERLDSQPVDVDLGAVREHIERGLDQLPQDAPGRMAFEDALAVLDDGDSGA